MVFFVQTAIVSLGLNARQFHLIPIENDADYAHVLVSRTTHSITAVIHAHRYRYACKARLGQDCQSGYVVLYE